MAILLIEYRVPDFGAWKRIFDRDPLGRAHHRATGHVIYADADRPDQFILGIEFDSLDDARAFRDLPGFREVWEISGAGRSWIVDPVETVTYSEGRVS